LEVGAEVETEARHGPVPMAIGAEQLAGAVVESAATVAVGGAGAVAEAVEGAEAETAAADTNDVVGDWRLRAEMNPGEECWWAVLDSGTKETVEGSAGLEEALKAFAMSVEVVGLRGDGQLLTELEDVSGGKLRLEAECGQTEGEG